jgi:hypothetical protein
MTKRNEPQQTARTAWQTGQIEPTLITLNEVRRRAAKMHRQVKWRNALEYFAGIIVIVAFAARIANSQSIWLRIGSALTLMATVFVLTNLHFRVGGRRLDPSGDCRTFYVSEMARQRDALKRVWLWYVLPFLPGFIVFRIGIHLQLPPEKALFHYAYDVSALAFAAFIVWRNHRAARRIQVQIGEAEKSLGKAHEGD